MTKKKTERQLLIEEIRELRIALKQIATREDVAMLGKKIDHFMDLLDIITKRHKILEKKLNAIEDYFDPHPKN